MRFGEVAGLDKKDLAIFSLSFLYLFVLSFLQYSTLQIEWHDSGLILYALATPESVGHLWSYEYDLPFLAEHQSYLLEILSPVFRLIPFIEVWLLLQCCAIASGIVLFRKYLDSILENFAISTGIAFAFLLNPYVTHSHLYPHFEVFWIPFLSGFLLFSQKGNLPAGIFFLFLSLCVKEDGWIYAIACCWISLGRTPKKDLIIYISIIFIYYAVAILWSMAYFFPERVPHFASKWGKTQGELLKDMILHPLAYLRLLISGQSKYLLLSVLGLPFLSTWRAIPAALVSILWMCSVSLDRAFLSFYFGLPSVLLYYFSIPFAFRLGQEALDRFRWSPRLIVLPASGLIAVSVFLLFFPGDYSSRGPSLPKAWARSKEWSSSFETARTLVKIRSGCEEKVFASFSFGAYLFCGNDLRLPYRDWESVRTGKWIPDLVVLEAGPEEILPGPLPLLKMIEYFDQNPNYSRIMHEKNVILWRRK